jgi:iron complex outermembrane receptor protein
MGNQNVKQANLKNRLLYSACILSFTALAVPLHAYAQHGADTTTEDSRTLETVTVTAQFREQELQDVPNSVVAFTAQDIEDAGIRSTEDFIALTPNLTFDDSFTYLNSFVVVRGVTQINNADSPVAIIVDGVPQNSQKQFKMPLFDVQQIEVLKGPQGSLYGRNAIGGAINIVTKQPTNEFEGFVAGGLSNGSGYRMDAGISGPIVKDQLLFRVSGSYYETDGLIKNTYLGRTVDDVDHDYSIRGKLAYTPNEVFSFDLRASYNDVQAGAAYDAVVNSTLNPDFRSGNDSNDVFEPRSSLAGVTKADITDLSGKATLDMGFATATYILGYTDLNEDYRSDLDFSNPTQPTFGPFGELGQGQNLSLQLMSQELRFVSPDTRAFRWIAGAYYLQTDRSLLTRGFLDLNGSLDQFENGVIIIDRGEDNDNTAWALFGQTELDLSERATLQVGARYDEDQRNQNMPGLAGSGRSKTFDAFQPKVTLSYDITQDVLGYATYSTGFRSGGFNAPGVVLDTFGDEMLTNYELGLKSTFANGDGTFNIAAFASESDGFQFFFVDASTVSQIISNLDKVDLRGFDADAQYRISDQIMISGGVGYTDSEIKSIGNAQLETYLTASGVDISKVIGSHSPKTTEWSFNFGAQYIKQVRSNLSAVFRVDYEYQGEKFWQIDNVDVRDPVNLVSLRASLEGERWSASIWGKNLLDEEYYADFNPSEYAGAPFDLGSQARPATYGVDLKYKF